MICLEPPLHSVLVLQQSKSYNDFYWKISKLASIVNLLFSCQPFKIDSEQQYKTMLEFKYNSIYVRMNLQCS